MDHHLGESASAWAKEERIECLYFLCDCADHKSIQAAGQNGFEFIDIRVTLERRLDRLPFPNETGVKIRRSCPDDIPRLRGIARLSHTDSRFYADSHFDKKSCERLYETWIEKCCHANEGCVLVAIVNEQPAGYIACSIAHGQEGSIGLIAVSSDDQNRGIGAALLNAADGWFIEHQCAAVSVVTQGSNLRAQRLYQRRGFVVRSMQLWFHRWF